MKLSPSSNWLSLLVTLTAKVPAACGPVVQVIEEELKELTAQAAPPIETEEATKLDPEIVSTLPPPNGPEFALIDATEGGGRVTEMGMTTVALPPLLVAVTV